MNGRCGRIRVISSSLSDDDGEEADVSPPVVGFSKSVGGSSGAGVGGRRDDHRV